MKRIEDMTAEEKADLNARLNAAVMAKSALRKGNRDAAEKALADYCFNNHE